MITLDNVQTIVTAALFLAAGFLVVNVLLASGRVIRGKDSVSELPTRLIGVGFALALAFAAWPYARTAILDMVGRDAGAMVQTLNGLGSLPSVTTGSSIGLDGDEFSGQSWSNVTGAIMEAINAPEPEKWEGEQGSVPPETNSRPVEGPAAPSFLASPTVKAITAVRPVAQLGPAPAPDYAPLGTADNGAVIAGPEAPSFFSSPTIKAIMQPSGGPTFAQSPTIVAIERYTVKRGDTMHRIAKAQYGDGNKWTVICAANQPRDCDSLVSGQSLIIP